MSSILRMRAGEFFPAGLSAENPLCACAAAVSSSLREEYPLNRKGLGDIFQVQHPLYPMVSSTSPETELALGLRCCSLPTLEERCLSTLARNMTQTDSVDQLPLPAIVRWKLKSWNS